MLPKFPDSYVGQKAEEYNSQQWMERNQKRTTLKCIEYLFDKKLGNEILRKKSSLIIDLGSGTGFSSEILAQEGFRVIGIEILKDMLSLANKKRATLHMNLDLNYILADINYLPIRSNEINHLISISAYNFIIHEASSDREGKKIVNNAAKYLSKILKTFGRVIVEFYPRNERELALFNSSFTSNGFEGFMVKKHDNQKSGQTFLLLKKKRQ